MEDQNVENQDTVAEVVEETTNEAAAPAEAQAQQGQQPQVKSIFNSISYTKEEDFEDFLSKLDKNQAVIVLMSCAQHAQRAGILSVNESEAIAKAFRVLGKNTSVEQAPQSEG